MIVVYPFSTVDQDLALKNARWMKELGPQKSHDLLLLYDRRCVPEIVKEIHSTLTHVFNTWHLLEATTDMDGWPEGANYFFRLTCTWMQYRVEQYPYFLWLEPDAIPMREGWLDQIWKEYVACKRPFMGDRVEVRIGEMEIPLHMSGVGIYPNPIYNFAGECYRAHDEAWDMAAREQIVPQAYFTSLIEHAWKHPTFKDYEEIKAQISPDTVLFHSSKDGSLIDLLRGSSTKSSQQIADGSAVQVGGPAPGSGGVAREVLHPASEAGHAGSSPVPPTCDIFIRTYPGDYQWLLHCLASVGHFCTGFRKLTVVSPAEPPDWWNAGARAGLPDSEWKVIQDETEDGYLAQQITKCYADLSSDSDYILHVDSDVIFTRPTTPKDFFAPVDPWGENLVWYYTPYPIWYDNPVGPGKLQVHWKSVVEKFMHFEIPYEFMRTMPLMIPRWLYPKLREFCHNVHGIPLCDYIRTQPKKMFSEFNALGAYAYFHHKDEFEWRNTLECLRPPSLAKQFQSWAGVTPQTRAEIENILRGAGASQPAEVTVAHTPEPPADPAPSQIKVLPSGVWVLEDDSHVSRWIEQEGRLDHDQNTLPIILPLIKPGQTVVDIGAFVGDHTIAYAEAVGPEGTVYAFEPNPIAFKCLCNNMMGRENVRCENYGLSDQREIVPLSGNNHNAAGAYVGDHMKITDVQLRALETEIPWRVDFIKIDAEGYELKVLRGAGNLINKCNPIMVIEVNEVALERQGFKPSDIYMWLDQHGYQSKIIQETCSLSDPMYDIICSPIPITQPPEAAVAVTPVAFPLITLENVKELIDRLKEFSNQSRKNKAAVNQRLVYHKMRTPNPKKKPSFP